MGFVSPFLLPFCDVCLSQQPRPSGTKNFLSIPLDFLPFVMVCGDQVG